MVRRCALSMSLMKFSARQSIGNRQFPLGPGSTMLRLRVMAAVWSVVWSAVWSAVLAGIIGWSVPVWSAEDGDRKPPEPELKVQGGETVVRPKPHPERPLPFPADKYTPGARTVIPRDKFKKTQQSVADVLEEVPGLTLTRRGDDLAPTRVSIRGSRSDQVLILLDGVALGGDANDAAARRDQGRSGVDLATLPLSRIESIEVLRGAASGIYGPGAAAGAIVIRTRRPTQPELTLSATQGSHGFQAGEIFWSLPWQSKRQKKQSLGLHFNYRKSAGDYVYYDAEAANAATTGSAAELCAVPLGDGYFERRCNRKTSASLELDWREGKHRRVSAAMEGYWREGLGGVENPRPFGRETKRQFQLRYQDALALVGKNQSADNPASIGWKINLSRVRAERIENTTLPQNEPPAGFDDFRGQSELWWEAWRGRGKFHAALHLGRQTLEDRAFDAGRSSYALAGAWSLNRDAGTLETALRHDRLTHFEGKTTGRIAFSETLYKGFGLKGSYGTGYRPPTLYELYDPGAFSGGSVANPDLRSENSTSVDGGAFLQWGKSVFTQVFYFYQDIRENIIALPAPDSPNLFRFENVNRTRSTGLEASLNLRAGRKTTLDFTWTRTKALILNNDAVDPRNNGNRVPGVPDTQWKTALGWRGKGWRVWFHAKHSGLRFVDKENTRFLQPYTLFDGGVLIPLGRHFEVVVEGKNLGNITYSEVDNFPPPGRRGLVTLRWNPLATPKTTPNKPAKPR